MKVLFAAVLLLLVGNSQAQDVKLGMTKSEVKSLISQHPEWSLSNGVIVSISPVDSPHVTRDEDHGTFKIKGYKMHGLKGNLEYRLSPADTVDRLIWRSDYLRFGKNRRKALSTLGKIKRDFTSQFGVARSSQHSETLVENSYWDIDEGELRLIYDPRFPHIFVVWFARKE